MQLDFLWKELQGYTSVLNALKGATTVKTASDAVLTGYERPADQGDAVKEKRAGYGQTYFDKYAGTKTEKPAAMLNKSTSGDTTHMQAAAEKLRTLYSNYLAGMSLKNAFISDPPVYRIPHPSPAHTR